MSELTEMGTTIDGAPEWWLRGLSVVGGVAVHGFVVLCVGKCEAVYNAWRDQGKTSAKP
jgi:hypothetical protein